MTQRLANSDVNVLFFTNTFAIKYEAVLFTESTIVVGKCMTSMSRRFYTLFKNTPSHEDGLVKPRKTFVLISGSRIITTFINRSW